VQYGHMESTRQAPTTYSVGPEEIKRNVNKPSSTTPKFAKGGKIVKMCGNKMDKRAAKDLQEAEIHANQRNFSLTTPKPHDRNATDDHNRSSNVQWPRNRPQRRSPMAVKERTRLL
jgi:hypothetical protein